MRCSTKSFQLQTDRRKSGRGRREKSFRYIQRIRLHPRVLSYWMSNFADFQKMMKALIVEN